MPIRINKFVARATGLSRRAADQLVTEGRVKINGQVASLGEAVNDGDVVTLDGRSITAAAEAVTIMLNKPAGYVCSRNGQGSPTIYELLPAEYRHLKPVGRLDKDSSGLLLLTDDGDLANQLTHPRYSKEKVYEIKLDRPLQQEDSSSIEQGVQLEDGLSRLNLRELDSSSEWQVTMSEGRNRQIRRTFAAVGYQVTKLQRVRFGDFSLGDLVPGSNRIVA